MSILLINDTFMSNNNSLLINDTISLSEHNRTSKLTNSKSPFENSNSNDLNHLEKEIINLMDNKKYADERSKMDSFKELFLNLHNQIAGLMEEVKFLREDTNKKSNMINKLIDITTNFHKNSELNDYKGKHINPNQTLNTPIVIKEPSYDNTKLRLRNVNARRNMDEMLNDLNSTPITKEKSENRYFEFPRVSDDIEMIIHQEECITVVERREAKTNH